jgi:alanyl-tRNA synthetase
MPFPTEDTTVDYPSGGTESASTVLHIEEIGPGLAVVLDRTAFHPIDGHWPDQPADRGRLILSDGTGVDVLDAVVGATDGERLYIGDDVPVRTGTEGWAFVVVHIVRSGTPIHEGERVGVVADAAYREALSRGHTACHLASLALDRALADAWSKAAPTDSLGAPAFDQLAIERSEILEDGARDTYRIGKSLRKKGFDPAAFDDSGALAARVNETLGEWIATDAAVRVEAPEPGIGARRSWVCALPGHAARIPCGGTHARSLGELGAVTVAFAVTDVPGARTVVMTTTVDR